MNRISLCAKLDRIIKLEKKNTITNGARINLPCAVSPFIAFLHPFPDAGESVPFHYRMLIKKKTGNPYVSISQNSL